MVLTMQRLLSGGELADMLNVHADDIGAEGSGLDYERCLQKVEEAYRLIANEAAVSEAFELEDSLIFTPTGAGKEKAFAWPDRVNVIRTIEGWDSTNSTPTRLIYNREYYDRPGFQQEGGYHISNAVFRTYNPIDTSFKATFFRAPGELCYGTCGASSTASRVYLGAPTAGTLNDQADGYVGDRFAVIYANGSVVTRRVTAYSASGGYVDLGEALDIAPGSSDSWSFVPFMRDAFHTMLLQLTAGMFEDAPNAAVNAAKGREALSKYISTMSPIDSGAPSTVRQVAPGPQLSSYWGNTDRSNFGERP